MKFHSDNDKMVYRFSRPENATQHVAAAEESAPDESAKSKPTAKAPAKSAPTTKEK